MSQNIIFYFFLFFSKINNGCCNKFAIDGFNIIFDTVGLILLVSVYRRRDTELLLNLIAFAKGILSWFLYDKDITDLKVAV